MYIVHVCIVLLWLLTFFIILKCKISLRATSNTPNKYLAYLLTHWNDEKEKTRADEIMMIGTARDSLHGAGEEDANNKSILLLNWIRNQEIHKNKVYFYAPSIDSGRCVHIVLHKTLHITYLTTDEARSYG